MNVRELRKMLKNYPDDMEIIHSYMSDMEIIEESDWSVIKAVPQPSVGYVMRAHPTMSAENKAKQRKYLYLKGN